MLYQFKELTVEYQYNPKLKHSYIQIKRDSTLKTSIVVKTALKSMEQIDKMLLEREAWIRKQLQSITTTSSLNPVENDKYLLFGNYHDNYSKNFTSYNQLELFYKEKAKKYLTLTMQKYANIMNVNYNELKFRKMKSRWGSCNSNGVITLNTHLIKLKKELIAYVIVHELAHLVHMNHSRSFHKLVEQYLPDSKKLRVELKKIILN